MKTHWLSVSTADGPMEAYLAEPDGGGPYPGVLVLQDAFGVNAYVQTVVDRLADAGYVALAPELFHRAGVHVVPGYEDTAQVVAQLAALTNGTIEEDCGASLAALRARTEVNPKRLGVVGFGLGGLGAILTGLTAAVEAVIAFYPAMLVHALPNLKLTPLVDRISALRAATLIQLGGADPRIPPEDVEAVRHALVRATRRHEIVVWPGASHGFHDQDRTPVYHPHAAEQAWHRTLGWFDEVLRSAA